MSRLISILCGPELLWVVFYLLCGWLKARNLPATPAGNAMLEKSCTLGMFLATALTFVVFAVPGTNRWLLLIRVIVAAGIGLNVCLFRLLAGINYGDSRNSGVFGYWFYGLMTGALALLPGILLTIFLLRRAAAKGL